MRNLKRVLSLALALVMVLGMMVVTTSAAAYTDAEEITYTEAVDVATGLGLFEGYDDGEMKPDVVLTREQAATLITRIMLGDKLASELTPTKQIFDDVATTRWSAAAIEYCYNIDMIDGLGDGTFDPTGELTGTAFAKLLLCAMGYDAAAEGYTGTNWKKNIHADAMTAGLMIDGVNIAGDLTREQAAQMILQAMTAGMVEYTTAYDYATGAYVLYGPKPLTKTFQKTYFPKLEKATGVITAVDAKGTTLTNKLTSTKVSAKNVDWTDIGYAAYSWYLNGQKEDVQTWTSISDVYVTGVSLATSTNGIPESWLTTAPTAAAPNPYYLASVDSEDCTVYYNGVKVGAYGTATASYLAKAAQVGCKIDFVDNDKQGKAESVIITEYTYDRVTNVAKKSYSGTVYDYQYALTGTDSILASKLANVKSLSKGDHITYVVYGGKYYVNVLTSSVMELDIITREKLADEVYKVYTFDGVDYIASDLAKADVDLYNTDIDEEFTVALDEYGYIVYASQYSDPDAYLYVMGNNHTDFLGGTTKTAVVYADGTADYVSVSTVYNYVTDNSGVTKLVPGYNFDNAGIAEGIYSYALDKNGNYVLVEKVLKTAAVADTLYETNDLYFGDKSEIALTQFTTIVDLRKSTFGTVYTGYSEIPDTTSGKIVYYGDLYTKLGYMIEGTDTANYTAEFVVFDTTFNKAEIVGYNADRSPIYAYTLVEGVLVDGVLVENYVLTEDQHDAIVANGVGSYTWSKTGVLRHVQFNDVPDTTNAVSAGTIFWTPENSGKLVKGSSKDVTDEYTAIFLDLYYGEINYWFHDVIEGEYYCIYDDTVRTNKIVYIVADATKAEIDKYLEDQATGANAALLSEVKVALLSKINELNATDAYKVTLPADVLADGTTAIAVAGGSVKGWIAAVEAGIAAATDAEAYVEGVIPHVGAVATQYLNALKTKAAEDAAAIAALPHRGEKFDIICRNNESSKGLYFEIKNFKFDESLKVVLYTAEGKEIGSMAAVANTHSTLLTGKDISLTGGTWYPAGASETETHWVQTGSAEYLNVASYASLYIDGKFVESIKITWKDNTDHTHEFTADTWAAWLDKAL